MLHFSCYPASEAGPCDETAHLGPAARIPKRRSSTIDLRTRCCISSRHCDSYVKLKGAAAASFPSSGTRSHWGAFHKKHLSMMAGVRHCPELAEWPHPRYIGHWASKVPAAGVGWPPPITVVLA